MILSNNHVNTNGREDIRTSGRRNIVWVVLLLFIKGSIVAEYILRSRHVENPTQQ